MLKKINNHQKTKINGFKNSKSIYITVGLTSLTILSGLVLSSSTVSADDVVDNVAITVPVSCTMSGTGMNTHTKEVVNGTYEENIGTTTMKVLCNDNSGFSIYATGFTNETIAETNSNKLVGTNASGNATIDTGLAQSGNTSNWAMKLATNSQATYPITITSDAEGPFSSYHTVPNEYTKVATRLAGTDTGTNAEGATLTSTYAAYISKTQAADTYTGKVKYTLVHPNDAPAPTPPITPSCPTPVPNLTYMQDLNSSNKASILANMTEDAQYFLKDKRDETPYCVAKLKDGNIWMTESLDLAGGTALSAEDTDVASAYISSFSTSNNLTKSGNTIVLPPSAIQTENNTSLTDDTQFSIDNYSYVFNSHSKETWNGDVYVPAYSYYSWDAATLGSGRSISTENTDAPYSICPKGWRLPTSGADHDNGWKRGDFYKLATAYGIDLENSSTKNYDNRDYLNKIGPGTPPNYLLASNYSYGFFEYEGEFGTYWSSTSSSSTDYAISMSLDSNINVAEEYYNRFYGQSIRCLAKN